MEENASADWTWQDLSRIQQLLIVAAAFLGASGLTWAVAVFWPHGVDFAICFYPVGRLWLTGETILYDLPANCFHYPPWTLWLTLPFSLPSEAWGRGLLWTASMLTVGLAALVFSEPGRARPWILAFVLFNLHTFDLLQRGQIDALTTAGTVVGWLAITSRKPMWLGAAYVFLSAKPPNSIPVALLFAVLSWRRWSVRDFAASLILPVIVIGLSFVVFPGWIPRWLTNLRLNPGPVYWLTSIWRIQDLYDLPPVLPWLIAALTIGLAVWGWRRAQLIEDEKVRTLSILCLIICATFLVTPYSLSYHYVILIAVVLPFLFEWHIEIGIGLYALTFIPLLRILIGVEFAWLDILLVIAAFAAVIAFQYVFSSAAITNPQNLKESPV